MVLTECIVCHGLLFLHMPVFEMLEPLSFKKFSNIVLIAGSKDHTACVTHKGSFCVIVLVCT